MSRPTPPTYKTMNWPAYNEALKRRVSLTIWFDPAMTWEAVPTGKRGRQPAYGDAAIQTCLTMKVLFGMALRQTTGFVEPLAPDRRGLGRTRLQHIVAPPEDLKVNIPYRGSQGPLHLLIDSTGIKGRRRRGMERPQARRFQRRVWRKIHIGIDEKTLEIRAAEFTTSDVGDAPMLPELLDQIPPEQRIASPPTAPSTPKCHDAIAARGAAAIIHPQERQALEARHRRGGSPTRSAHIEARREDHLATMERLSPPKPRRDQDALRQAAGSAPVRTRLRPTGRGVPGPCRRPERLHRARYAHHGSRRIGLSGKGTRPSADLCNRAVRGCETPAPRAGVYPRPQALLRGSVVAWGSMPPRRPAVSGQQFGTFTARPPRLVSLYFSCMSCPV